MPRERPDAVTQAVKLLGGRDRTEAKLRAALATRAYPPDEIDHALTRVKALGYLDDARVAERLAKAGMAEGRSIVDLSRRLVRDGIDEALAASAVADAAREAGHDELEAAKALLAKRRLTGAKAARFLAARGFSEDVIGRLVTPDEE